jgi:hypothetical protein
MILVTTTNTNNATRVLNALFTTTNTTHATKILNAQKCNSTFLAFSSFAVECWVLSQHGMSRHLKFCKQRRQKLRRSPTIAPLSRDLNAG